MSQETTPTTRNRILAMLSLILAGEAIFIPPFHLGRYFKTSMLATFHIDEYQLGQLGAAYGVTAMIAYLVGGPVADRFSPRKLLAVSLVATGSGCLYMATFPSFAGLYGLFAFWGASTILLFWAPMIRATREWGGPRQQGMAFGLLDGGRGLAAAVIAALATEVFRAREHGALDDPSQHVDTLRILLFGYFAVCVLAAVCVWWFVPDSPDATADPLEDAPKVSLARRLGGVAKLPSVWCQAIVILAAYSAYKMFDYYGLYTEDAYGFSTDESALATSYLSFLRVGAAIGAGWIADRLFGIATTVALLFGILAASYGCFLLLPMSRDFAGLMLANMALGCVAFYGLRGIYFALLESSHTPRELTGSAVGVICFIGFIPEIYMPPLTGWLIREARADGNVLVGYEQLFWFLVVLSLIGMAAAAWLRRLGRESTESSYSEETK